MQELLIYRFGIQELLRFPKLLDISFNEELVRIFFHLAYISLSKKKKFTNFSSMCVVLLKLLRRSLPLFLHN